MKTKEELNTLKEEAEAVNEKLRELTEDELRQVTGGGLVPRDVTSRTAKERCDKLAHDGNTIRIKTNYEIDDDE